VYKCPHCDFVERPRVPRKSHKKNDPPRPAQKKCITHKVTPELISCECIIKTQEVSTGWIVSCQGIHQHPKPPPITLNQDAYNEFAKWVKVGPGIKPKNLTVGNHTREGVGAAIHPALYNLDRTRYLRNKVLAGSSLPSSLDGIIAWAKRVDFIQSSSLGGKDGHICMQNKGMLKLLSEMASPMQTDSVHGFVYYHSDALPQSFLYESKDPALRSKADYSNEEINITFTSIFDDVLGRTVPVLVSLLFGKTADHYKAHFLQLFESLQVSTFEEFEEKFKGTTADMSAAELGGFMQALREFVEVKFGKEHTHKANVQKFYKFCRVHFIRSLTRVARNGAVIQPREEKNFKDDVMSLLDIQDFNEFERAILTFKQRYPRANKWISWYLLPQRAQIMFPACKTITAEDETNFRALSDNTNAQENLGGDFKKTHDKAKISVGQAIEHAYRWCFSFFVDRNLELRGFNTRYSRGKLSSHKKSRKKQWKNDGRPPDTTKELVGVSTRRGRKNKGLKEVDFQGLKWGVVRDEYEIANTCRLDVILTLFFKMNELRLLERPMIETTELGSNSLEDRSFELIRRGCGDEVRFLWATEVFKLQPSADGVYCMWGCMKTLLHKRPHAFRRTLQWHILNMGHCGNKRCPYFKPPEDHQYSTQLMLDRGIFNWEERASVAVHEFLSSEDHPVSWTMDNEDRIVQDCGLGGSLGCEREWRRGEIVVKKWPHVALITYAVPGPQLDDKGEEKDEVEGASRNFQDVEEFFTVRNKVFRLRAAYFSNRGHFTGCLVKRASYLYYDGMKDPMITTISKKNPHELIKAGYFICGLFYEVLDKASAAVQQAEMEAVSALTILRDPELASQLTNQDESEFEETVESCREVLHQPWRKQQQPVTDTAIQERLDKLAGRKNTRIAKTNTKKKPNSKVQQNLLSTFQPVTLSKKHPTTQQGSLTRQKKHQSPAVQKVAPKTSQEMHSPSVEHTHHTRSRSRLSLPKNRRSPQETKHTTRSGRKITRKRDRDSAFDFSTSARKKT